MANLEDLAQTCLHGEPLALRSVAQDWLATCGRFAEVARPETSDPEILVVAAALLELFALRAGETAPPWTSQIEGLPEVRFLVRSAATMKHLRRMCEEESPWPLKRRNLFAPADFLTFA